MTVLCQVHAMDVGEPGSHPSQSPPQLPQQLPESAPESSPPPLPSSFPPADAVAREAEVTVESVTVVPSPDTAPFSPEPSAASGTSEAISTGSASTIVGPEHNASLASVIGGPAVVMGGWAPRAVWAWLVVFVSLGLLVGTFCRFLDGVIGGKVPFNNPQLITTYLLPTAIPALVLALIGTLMGWSTLVTLRRANGQRRGLFAGLVAALSWPLLIFTVFGLLFPAGMLTGFLERQGNQIGPVLWFTAWGVSIVVDLVLLISFSKWSASLKTARAALAPGAQLAIRHRPVLVGVAAFLHFAGVIVLGVSLVVFVANRANEERNRPMPGFEDTNVPPPPEVVPEPPPEVRPQRPRKAVDLESQLKPGGLGVSRQILMPPKDQPTLLRMTFWSNGVPVDLPAISFQSAFPGAPDKGVLAEWQLKRSQDGAHYTLSAPHLEPATKDSPSGEAALEIPEDVQLIPVPNGDQALLVRPIGPTRRWLFLSTRDAQMGAKLNAEWGVSLDFAVPSNQ